MPRSRKPWHLCVCAAATALLSSVTALQAAERSWEESLAAGRNAYDRADYEKAQTHFLSALSAAKKSGPARRGVATCLLALGEVHLRAGRYVRADRAADRAQCILEKVLGPEHPEVARCLQLRAEAYRHLGLFRVAAKLCRRSLALRENALGRNHLEVADSLETLGWICLARPEEAEVQRRTPGAVVISSQMPDLLYRARDIRKRFLANEDPRWVANDLVCSGWDLRKPANDEAVQRAEQRLRRSLAAVVKVRGEEHPETGECLLALGRAYTLAGKYRQAEESLNKAVGIWRRALGCDHPRIGEGLRALADLRFAQGQLAQADALAADSLRFQFARLSDPELCRFFAQFAADQDGPLSGLDESTYETYLVEMARRGGPAVERCLQDRDQTLRARHAGYFLYQEFRNTVTSLPLDFLNELPYLDDPLTNLELFTALRRAQGRPDPVQFRLTGLGVRESTFPELPVLTAALSNCDVTKQAAGFTAGGDYRSGRQARWCIQMYDAHGRRLPVRPHLGGEGGGVYQRSTIRFGQAWKTGLRMNDFIEVEEPGEYAFRVHYHDTVCLADRDEPGLLARRITCRSETFKLTVKPRVIELTRADQTAVRQWVRELQRQDPVKVVAGAYGEWAYRLLDPGTPGGHILRKGWKAVPTLLDELSDAKLSPKRRAWILALLFSITGRNDPRRYPNVVLGNYDDQDGPWEIQHGFEDDPFSGGFGFSGVGSTRGEVIDEGKQCAFARRWSKWRKYLEIKVAPENPGRKMGS